MQFEQPDPVTHMPLVWKIDECSAYENRIHLRGWCFDRRSPIEKVEAVFAEPLTVVPLKGYGLLSPDVEAAMGFGAVHNRFDEWIDVPSASVGLDFRLQFTLKDGLVVLGSSVLENARIGAA
jgi:hypothetical protein